MEIIVDLLVSVFNILVQTKIFNVPVIVWLILPALIALVVKFIQGKK